MKPALILLLGSLAVVSCTSDMSHSLTDKTVKGASTGGAVLVSEKTSSPPFFVASAGSEAQPSSPKVKIEDSEEAPERHRTGLIAPSPEEERALQGLAQYEPGPLSELAVERINADRKARGLPLLPPPAPVPQPSATPLITLPPTPLSPSSEATLAPTSTPEP